MRDVLSVGGKHSAELIVTKAMTVPGNADKLPTFADMPEVLATAFYVAFIPPSKPVSTCYGPIWTRGNIALAHSLISPMKRRHLWA